MWPWGHFAVAYLLYSLYSRGRFRRPPRSRAALAVGIGSQFADLIDKPLAWGFGVFPTGRDFAHSLLFATALIVAVYLAAVVLDRIETATAFVIAHMSHVVTDLPPRVFLGYPVGAEFLLWPLLPHETFEYNERLFEPPAVVELVVTPFTEPLAFFLLNGSLFVLALGVWYIDGCPGLQSVRGR